MDSWHNLSEETWESCHLYSRNEFEGTWSIRDERAGNSVDPKKLKLDSLRGKCAECVAHQIFIAKGFLEVTAPDFKIYERKKKNFGADLRIGEVEIHVKSCTPEDGRDPSWLFQKSDPLVIRPQTNQIICFMYISLDGRRGTIYKLCESHLVFPNLIDAPRSPAMRGSKIAVYQAALEKEFEI